MRSAWLAGLCLYLNHWLCHSFFVFQFGRTEVIDNTLNPDFVRKFILDYFFEERQNLRFDLWVQLVCGSVYACSSVFVVIHLCISWILAAYVLPFVEMLLKNISLRMHTCIYHRISEYHALDGLRHLYVCGWCMGRFGFFFPAECYVL